MAQGVALPAPVFQAPELPSGILSSARKPQGRAPERALFDGLQAQASALAPAPKRGLQALPALNRLFDFSKRGLDEPALVQGSLEGLTTIRAAVLAPPKTLAMDLPGRGASGEELDQALKVYEASLPKPLPPGQRAALAAWTALGIAGLLAFAWLTPWTGPLVLILRAAAAVESIGYVFHRFFQHVSSLTRIDYPFLVNPQDPDAGHRFGLMGRAAVALGNFIRRNQMYHWVHHMIIYPIGRFFHKAGRYVSAEAPPKLRKAAAWPIKLLFAPVAMLLSLGLSWLAAALVGMGLSAAVMGLTWTTLHFLVAVGLYAWFVGYIHGSFHIRDHFTRRLPLIGRVFEYLHDIHELHHYDQRKNFMILLPIDILFGTYMSPRRHQAELAVVREDRSLTASDIINWRYLLNEATPAQRAVYISRIQRDNFALERIGLLMRVLRHRLYRAPEDGAAEDLRKKSADLLRQVNTEKSRRILQEAL